MRSRLLLYFSVAASIAYLCTARWQPFPGSPLVKGCAVGALALLAVGARARRRDAGVLALALAFCTAGDILLDLSPNLFPLGLGAFLLGHLTYVCLFVRNRTTTTPALPTIAMMLAVLIFSVALSVWIVPSVGGLAVPVVLYICALTAMVCTAILARFELRWVAVGAILFLISDSLLAIHKFRQPVPMRDFLVWTTYYLGQCGITLGYLRSSHSNAHTLPNPAAGHAGDDASGLDAPRGFGGAV